MMGWGGRRGRVGCVMGWLVVVRLCLWMCRLGEVLVRVLRVCVMLVLS